MCLRHPFALAPIVLALLIGCAGGDESDGVRVQTGTLGGTQPPGSGANATASPTPSPTPSESASASPDPTPSPSASTITSGVDASAPPASVDTLPTAAPAPTPTATPLGAIVGTAQLSGGMLGVACPPRSNTLWLLGASDLHTLDAGLGYTQAQDLSLPASPAALRFGPDGDMWVIGGTSLVRYVPQLMGWTVQVAPLPATAIDLAVDANEAWVVTSSGISRFSKAELSRTDFALASPTAIALDASNAWVTSASDNVLLQVNRATGGVTRTSQTGANPVRVALDASGGIWTINQGGNSLTHLTSADATPVTVPLAGSPTCLWADANTLWVGRADKQAVRVDAAQGVQGTTPLSFVPTAVTQDANGRVWFMDATGRSLAGLKGR